MTSTNDGKDVKIIQSSGQKSKSYYIELYTSLEKALSSDNSLEERTRHVCEAWRRVYSLYQHSATTTHPHLLSWLQRHTANTVLQSKWAKSKNERARLTDAIDALVAEATAASAGRPQHAWEQTLLQRAAWFRKAVENPWDNPVLKSLINPDSEPVTDEQVLEWLISEHGVVLVTRLQRMVAAGNCDDLALLLASAVMDRARAAIPHRADDRADERVEDTDETHFVAVLEREAGFTSEEWEMLTDIELVLLLKTDKRPRCIELAKLTPLRHGFKMVERLRKRLEISPRDKKLWKHAKEVATIVTQVVIARCMVLGQCAGAARDALYWCARALARLVAPTALRGVSTALAAPAATARHLHTFCAALSAECKELKTDVVMKPFICELYIRAITAGMNELEQLKLKAESEAEARQYSETLAGWFTQLGGRLADGPRLRAECALTAFSVHPARRHYERVAATRPPHAAPARAQTSESTPSETASEYGSWANDSRTQSNLVKTSETLQLKQSQKHQANVLSTAILTEGETLGLEPELCQDLAVLLSGPRVKTLSWDMDREVLLENCRSYMEKTHGGTRAVTTELKYLNLDPNAYQHLPEEDDDENDVYYGIEKGYEHEVQFEEPEEIWQSAFFDPEQTESAEENEEERFGKKKSKAGVDSEEDEDPLSTIADAKKEKKKRAKEQRKKKTHNRDGSQEGSKERRKDKDKDKKPKKERKNKSEQLTTGSLTSLLGMKVGKVSTPVQDGEKRVRKKKERRRESTFSYVSVTDSDYNSQGKPSQMCDDPSVLVDGVFSMDELKSPERLFETQKPIDNTKTAIKSSEIQNPVIKYVKTKPAPSPRVTTSSDSDAARAKSPYLTPNQLAHRHVVNPTVKSSLHKLLQFRRNQNKMRTVVRPPPAHTPTQSNTLVGLKVYNPEEIPKVYLNKKQCKQLEALSNDVDTLIKEVGTAENMPKTSYYEAKDKLHSPQNMYNPQKYSPQYKPMQMSQNMLNDSQQHGQYATHSPLKVAHQTVLNKAPNSVIQSHVSPTKIDIAKPHALNLTPPKPIITYQPFHKSMQNLSTDEQDVPKKPLLINDPNYFSQQHVKVNTSQLSPRILSNTVIKLPIQTSTSRDLNNSQVHSNLHETFSKPALNMSEMTNLKSDVIRYGQKQISGSMQNITELHGSSHDATRRHISTPSDMSHGRAKSYNVISHNDALNSAQAVYSNTTQTSGTFQNRDRADTKTPQTENNDFDEFLLEIVKSMNTSTNGRDKNVTVALNKDVKLSYVPKAPKRTDSIPHSAKQQLQQKKSENAPNTFSRLSYMHKSKQNEKAQLTGTVPLDLDRSVIEHKILKAKCIKNEVTISRVGKTNANDTENITNRINKSGSRLKRNCPVLSSMLESSRTSNTQTYSNLPTTSHNSLDNQPNREDADLLLLLRNQSVLKPNPNTIVTTRSDGSSHQALLNLNSQIKVETQVSSTRPSLLGTKVKNINILESSLIKKESEDNEWKRVMDAIRAQKTEPLGPNALDLALKKEQRRNSHTSARTSGKRVSVPSHSSSQNRPSDVKKREVLSSKPCLTTRNPSPEKHSQVPKKPRDAEIIKKVSPEMYHRMEIQSKQSSSNLNKGVPPTSVIQSSDYDMLEDLIDDDLRREIGEILSDDDAYINQNVPSVKGKNHTNIPKHTSNVCKATNVPKDKLHIVNAKTFIPKTQANSKMALSNARSVENTSTSNHPNMTMNNSNHPGATQEENKPASVNSETTRQYVSSATLITDQVAQSTANNIVTHIEATQYVNSIVPTNVIFASVPQSAPVVVIRQDLVYDPYPTIRIHESQVNAELCAINPNVFAVNAAPNIAVYQTTQFAAPVINPFIIGNATTTTNVSNATAMGNKHVSPDFPQKELNMPDEDSISLETALRLSDAISDTADPPSMDFNMNRNCERKVLSQVQENHTNDFDKESHKNKLSTRDLPLKTEQDEERIKLKRQSLINRKISHYGGYPPIALTYAPLSKIETLRNNLQYESPKNGIAKSIIKLMTNTVNDIVTESAKSPIPEVNNENIESTNQVSNSKEKSKSCRRIWLRSSNKISIKAVSPVKRPKIPFKRNTIKLPIKTVKNLQNEIKDSTIITKRTSKRIIVTNKPDDTKKPILTEMKQIIVENDELIDFENELNGSIVLKPTVAMLDKSVPEPDLSVPVEQQHEELEDIIDTGNSSQCNEPINNILKPPKIVIEKLQNHLDNSLVIKNTSEKTSFKEAYVMVKNQNQTILSNNSIAKECADANQSSTTSNTNPVKVIPKAAAPAVTGVPPLDEINALRPTVLVDGKVDQNSTSVSSKHRIDEIIKHDPSVVPSSPHLDELNKAKATVVDDQPVLKQTSTACPPLDDLITVRENGTTTESVSKTLQTHDADSSVARSDEIKSNNLETSSLIPTKLEPKETTKVVKSNGSVISINADTVSTNIESKIDNESVIEQHELQQRQQSPDINPEPVTNTIETSESKALTETNELHLNTEILECNLLDKFACKQQTTIPPDESLWCKENINEVPSNKSLSNKTENVDVQEHMNRLNDVENAVHNKVQTGSICNASRPSVSNTNKNKKPKAYMKGDIKIEEIPLDEPNKHLVRIQLPNGKIFKLTITGKIQGDYDSLFAEPRMQAILADNYNDGKKYTITYKQVQNALIVDLNIKEKSLQPVSVVNLISDDEDEVQTLSFNTEFGKYTTDLDQETIALHQKKFDKKCEVKMVREDIFKSNRTKPKSRYLPSEKSSLLTRNQSKQVSVPSTTNVVPTDETDSSSHMLTKASAFEPPSPLVEQANTVLVPDTADVIEIDDSSNDSTENQVAETNDAKIVEPVNISLLTNLLLHDLDLKTEKVKLPPIVQSGAAVVNLKSALLQDLGIVPLETPVIDITENDEETVNISTNIQQPVKNCDEDKPLTDAAIDNNSITEIQEQFHLKKCVVQIMKCENLIKKYEIINKTKHCFVKMERLNNLKLQSEGEITHQINQDKPEDFIVFDVDELSGSPQLSRCPSVSILNNWDDDSQPAMGIPYCTSPVKETYDTFVQMHNKLKSKPARESHKPFHSTCDSDWTMTKYEYNYQELLLALSNIPKTGNQPLLPDCDRIDSSNKLKITPETPNLLKLTLKFLEDNPNLLYRWECLRQNESILKTRPSPNKLKRKTDEVLDDIVASKVLKLGTLALNSFNSSFINMIKPNKSDNIEIQSNNVDSSTVVRVKDVSKFIMMTTENVILDNPTDNTRNTNVNMQSDNNKETVMFAENKINFKIEETKDCILLDGPKTEAPAPVPNQTDIGILRQEITSVPVDSDFLMEDFEVNSPSLLSDYIETYDDENQIIRNVIKYEAVNDNLLQLEEVASISRDITVDNLTPPTPISNSTSGDDHKQINKGRNEDMKKLANEHPSDPKELENAVLYQSVVAKDNDSLTFPSPLSHTIDTRNENKQCNIKNYNEVLETGDLSAAMKEEHLVGGDDEKQVNIGGNEDKSANENPSDFKELENSVLYQSVVAKDNDSLTFPSPLSYTIDTRNENKQSNLQMNNELFENCDLFAATKEENVVSGDDEKLVNIGGNEDKSANEHRSGFNKLENSVIYQCVVAKDNDSLTFPSPLSHTIDIHNENKQSNIKNKNEVLETSDLSAATKEENVVGGDNEKLVNIGANEEKSANEHLSDSKGLENSVIYQSVVAKDNDSLTFPSPFSHTIDTRNENKQNNVQNNNEVLETGDLSAATKEENVVVCFPRQSATFNKDILHKEITSSALSDNFQFGRIDIENEEEVNNLSQVKERECLVQPSKENNFFEIDVIEKFDISIDELSIEVIEVVVTGTGVHDDIGIVETLTETSLDIAEITQGDTSETKNDESYIKSPDYIDSEKITFNYHDYTKRKHNVTENSESNTGNNNEVVAKESAPVTGLNIECPNTIKQFKKETCPEASTSCGISTSKNHSLKPKPECKYELIQEDDLLTVNIINENSKDGSETKSAFVGPYAVEEDTVVPSPCSNNTDDINLKGFEFEDVYVFPLSQGSSVNSTISNDSLGQDSNGEVVSNSSLDDLHNINFHVKEPEITYSRKRKMSMRKVKIITKKYRKGKNIDCSRQTQFSMVDLAYSKEYKRLLEYCSSVKFSYSRPFHKECLELEGLMANWPLNGVCRDVPVEVADEHLFVDLEYYDSYQPDPTTQTFVEEISYKYTITNATQEDPRREASETNFNMGFGEGSGRVIQILKKQGKSNISAATLSDVKQSQPVFKSVDPEDLNDLTMINNDQIKKIRQHINYMHLRNKVRQFFEKSNVELRSEGMLENSKYKLHPEDFPFGLCNLDYVIPFPTNSIVQVVQVGQLPVSAAAQNPVTCDPRVTQVSDASPSQCSVDNSPNDHSQSEIKTEYTELTTADLTLPLQEYAQQNQNSLASQGRNVELTEQTISLEMEIKAEESPKIKQEVPDIKEERSNSSDRELHTLTNATPENRDYSFEKDTAKSEPSSGNYDPPAQKSSETFSHQRQQNGTTEKTDQIAHAMNAAGITTTPETMTNTRAHALVNILSQKIRQGSVNTTQTTTNTYSKASINAMALQQALAQILPPPLNQTGSSENNQTQSTTVGPQVLHIVQGKNASANQITLVDNSQQSVISTPNATQVLHIVQNKNATSGQASNGTLTPQTNSFSGLSLVDAGLQQGGNQLLHIVNTGNQKTASPGQLLKRVNLLTNLTNVQGSNEQKMVQFVCKSADGKAIQLNAPHQRSMVLRLQPIETPNVQTQPAKPAESQEVNPTPTSAASSKESASQQEIKSRSIYEENYAKFIQSSSSKTPALEKSTSLPKFNQAFGKPVFQEGSQKQGEAPNNNSHLPSVNTNSENAECPANDNAINLEHMGNIASPPLLIRKPVVTTQSQSNIVQQIKQTIAPMNIQTMHGGVIYTRQIPVNIGGGQTINLITVPSTELINDEASKSQSQTNQAEIEPSIIKIVPQSQSTTNTESSQEDSNNHASGSNENPPTPQPQPVLTQMRIKLPMLSKAPQMVPGARVVRPSFFQIQRNVIGGANQPVYQQLVLTAAPPLGQQTIRLPSQASRPVKVPSESQSSSSESQMSTSTLEQLREFDMVLEQVKERSTSTPSASSNNGSFKIHTSSSDTTDGNASSNCSTESTSQVLYSIGNNQSLNVAYVSRKTTVTTPTTSTYVRSPDSSGIADSPTSSSHVQIPHTVTTDSSPTEMSSQSKPAKVGGSKSKSRPKSTSNPPNTLKLSSSVPPKTSSQKPLEDEQTTQRILYILAEYKEQVENSPDKDKPAPRRRSNPPSNPGSSKRKKSSSSRRSGTRDMSPVHGEDTCRTMGSEDSSCGTSQGDCNESCLDSHSPQDSPRKVARKITFDQDLTATQPRPQPQRNVIVADGQTITVARGTTGKPATAVLMPANYILPVSMVKGGQQIAIVTNRGPKLLTVGGEGGATNALLLQRLIGPAGLKPVLARPGVRHVRLPTAALHNLQAFNLATATVQPPDSSASPTPGPTPPELVDTRATSSPWTDRDEVKPERSSSPEGSEPWNLPSADAHEYSYEETVRTDNMDRTVLDQIPDRYSPDMEAQRIFDKMFDVDSKKSYAVDSHDDSPRCAYDIDPSDSDDKAYQVVQKKDGSQKQHRLAHVSAAALRHKYAILEHELRLQKSLSEECEDLGVDSPSASELFPEAELLFANSPAHEHNQEHHSHTPQPHQSSIPQPDMDDQIATDHLIPRGIDVGLGLGDVGIVAVSEDGSATIALDQEEFARSHPNTTFHSEPTDGEMQPFTITGLKGRHITSTIFHSNSAPATVLMTAPQPTVISQAPEHSVKYEIENMMHSMPSSHNNDMNLSSVLVKDDGLTRYDSILTDSRELHLTNTASAIVHSSGNATQVIRRVCYEDDKRERDARYLIDEPDNLIAGDDAKMIAEDSSRDATLESMADVDDDRSSPERHAELFWESNSASERSESRRPLDFSSDSDKCCKSPSFDETNSTDSSVGTHMRLDSVIKEARKRDRSGSADGSSADDTHPPLRTYPPKRLYHPLEGEVERSLSGKTRAGERSPDSVEVRRRASGRGVVKRGCHCCTGSPAPPRPKKPRQRKPALDFTHN